MTYHFYPPGAGRFAGAGDRTAMVTVALLAGGLLVEVVGLVAGVEAVVLLGRFAALVGAVGYAYLIGGLLRQNRA